jgi:putative PIN family toxin of toxin-antitoxin system
MIARSGNNALLLLAIRRGFVVPCFSQEISEEYSGVLARPRFDFPQEQIVELMSLIQEAGERVRPDVVQGSSPDPGDDKFVACALAAKADYLVTGNKRHFPVDRIYPTKLVSAGELLNVITLEG